MTRQEAFSALISVRDEFEATKFAVGHVLRLSDRDPSLVGQYVTGLSRSDLQTCQRNLEATYFLRLFAVFEGTLRNYSKFGRKRLKEPPMERLMDSIGRYRHISPQHMHNAHAVRILRNDMIHEHQQELRLTFHDCKSHLATYISWLPPLW